MFSGKAEVHFLIAPQSVTDAVFIKDLMDIAEPFDRFKSVRQFNDSVFATVQRNAVCRGRFDRFLQKFFEEFRPHFFALCTENVFAHVTEGQGLLAEKIHVIGIRDISIVIQRFDPVSLLVRKEQRLVQVEGVDDVL